jgi:hypothetical protein
LFFWREVRHIKHRVFGKDVEDVVLETRVNPIEVLVEGAQDLLFGLQAGDACPPCTSFFIVPSAV